MRNRGSRGQARDQRLEAGRDPRIEAALAHHRIAYLATADRAGRPHVVPICFAYTDGTLYSVIDRKPKRAAPQRLRRVRNLLGNPLATAVVDVYSEDWSRLGYLLLEGRARLIEDGPEHSAALRLLRKKYPQYRKMRLEDRPVIALRVARAVAWGQFLLRSAGATRAGVSKAKSRSAVTRNAAR